MSADPSPYRTYVASLYTEHHGWLVGRLRRQLGCAFDAADLAQNTFMRVLSSPVPQPLHEPRAYLTVIARNLLVNFVRRRAIERACLEAIAALPEAVAPSPETRLDILQTLVEIDRRLDGLPAAAKQAFLMVQLDGLSQGEVARTLGISVSTVKRHLSRAALRCFFPEQSAERGQ